jgi:hypothetical protein
MRSNSRTEKIVLGLLFLVVTLLLVGSFESRLANSNGDDHPIVWARYFSNPTFWEGDGNFVASRYFGVASLPNLLATISVQWNANFPIWLSWIYLFIQNVVLGFGFYYLAKFWVEDKRIALAIALFSYAFTPWQQNLAYYPSMIHSPYPGHLVMPFIVLASYFLMRQKLWVMSLFLAIGGLIHPSQVLQFTLIAQIFLLLRNKLKIEMGTQKYFILPVVTSLIVPFFLIPPSVNPLTDSELMASALSNPHLVPWESTTFWPFGLPSLIGIFGLSFLACRELAPKFSELKLFWWANLLSLFLLGAIHFIGVKLRILPIILLCPLRVSVINSVLLSPLGFIYLLKKANGENRWLIWISMSLLFLMLFSQSGMAWGPLLALFVFEFQIKRKSKTDLMKVIFLAWWAAFFLFGRPLRDVLGSEISGALRFFMAPGTHLILSQIVIAFLLSLIAGLLLPKMKMNKDVFGNVWFVAALIFILIQSYRTGKETVSGELNDTFLVQTWAQKSTPEDSLFILESGSWRGVSNRKAQVVGFRENRILPYFRYREAKDFENKLSSIYQSFHTRDYNELLDSEVESLVNAFRGTHFVDKASNPKRKFPIAYENSSFRVYVLGRRS